MQLRAQLIDGIQLVSTQGRIDQAGAESFSAALSPYLADCCAGQPAIVLDFAGVEYISSIGLRALMLAHKQATAQRGRIAIAALTPLVAEVFAISHFDQVLKVYPTVADAIEALR